MSPRVLRLLTGLAALALLWPAAASAQDDYSFTASLLGGVGGSTDSADGGLSNGSFQLGLGLATELKTHVWLRYGQVDLSGDRFGSLLDPELSYLTVAGEYRFSESYYESGLFVGLGYYELSGSFAGGGGEDDTGVGLVLGATGEFRLHRRLALVGELAGHAVDLDRANAFLTAHAGLAVHF